MQPFSEEDQEGKEEFVIINQASPVFGYMQLLKSHLRQIGYDGHENYIASGYIFVMDGERKRGYKTWKKTMIDCIRMMHGIKITPKEFEAVINRLEQDENFSVPHGTN